MINKFFIVHIPNKTGAVHAKRFNDFTQADRVAKNNKGLLYELDEGQRDIGIGKNNKITGGKLIKDYSI